MGSKLNAELDIIEIVKLLRLTRLQLQKSTSLKERNMVRFCDDYTIRADGKSDAEDDGFLNDGKNGHNPGSIGIKNLSKLNNKTNPVHNFKTEAEDKEDI
jgi:hypothetical protein